jgi:hypothetical protein
MMGDRQVVQGVLFYKFSLEEHVPASHVELHHESQSSETEACPTTRSYDEKKFSPIFTAHARRWDTVHKRGDLRIEIPYPSAYSPARGVSPVTRVTTVFRETPARVRARINEYPVMLVTLVTGLIDMGIFVSPAALRDR